jgi:hypothetical protein
MKEGIRKEEEIKFFKAMIAANGNCSGFKRGQITCNDCKDVVRETNLFREKDVSEVIRKGYCIAYLSYLDIGSTESTDTRKVAVAKKVLSYLEKEGLIFFGEEKQILLDQDN